MSAVTRAAHRAAEATTGQEPGGATSGQVSSVEALVLFVGVFRGSRDALKIAEPTFEPLDPIGSHSLDHVLPYTLSGTRVDFTVGLDDRFWLVLTHVEVILSVS